MNAKASKPKRGRPAAYRKPYTVRMRPNAQADLVLLQQAFGAPTLGVFLELVASGDLLIQWNDTYPNK